MSNTSLESFVKRICPICKESDYTEWYQPPQSPGPVVQCKGCGFVYINPVQTAQGLIEEGPVLGDRPAHLLTSSDLTDIQGSWEEPVIANHMKEFDAKKINSQDALNYIHRLRPQRGKILDVGCFCGVFLSAAKDNGWDCYGVEPLVMPAIYARARFGLKVVTDTLRENTYPTDFFDVVTAFQVFEHLVHPEKEIDKLHKFIEPGGLLLIEVPNIETITVKILRAKHRHFVQDHVSFFSADTLGKLLEQRGFQIKKIYYPTRVLSVKHFIWWLGKYVPKFSNMIARLLPRSLLNKPIHINLKDIVAVIAEKK